MRLLALVGDGVVGRHDLADGGDFAAAATAAVTAGRRVVIAAIEQQALGFAAGVGGAVEEACRCVRRLAHEIETGLQHFEQRRGLVFGFQGLRTADLNALETAGALPRIDVGGKQTAGARRRFFHRIEERTGAGDRIVGKHIDQFGEIGEQRRLLGRQLAGDFGDDFVEGAGVLGLAIDLANAFSQRDHLATHGFALRFGDVELGNTGGEQLVDVMHRVGNRRVRADQRAFHAAGAHVRIEHRHGAAEQPLVLGAGAAGRHEQACTRQDRGFADRTFLERRGDHVGEILAIEQTAG